MDRTIIHKFRIVLLYVIAGLAILLVSCKKEPVNSANEEGNVTFSFQNNAENKLKSTSDARMDSVEALVVSIKDQNNNYVYNQEVIKLVRLNGLFISSPLQLKPGSYKLSAFMLVDENENVLFITPMRDSKYAYLVEKPLEFEFTVIKDSTTNIVPEVISSSGHQPKDFGYAFFSFDQVKTFDLLLHVFSSNGNSAAFTKSYLTITHDADTVFQDSLKAIPNVIKLPELSGDYTLVVTKSGVLNFSETFTLDSLKIHSPASNNPLIIILQNGTPAGLVFWNTLGSTQEITHSKVGPNLFFYDSASYGGGLSDIKAIPEFLNGKYGNAITIGPSADYFTPSFAHNVVLRNVSQVINSEHGCIEFWYYQKEDPLHFSYGIYRLWDGYAGLGGKLTFWAANAGTVGGLFNFEITVNPTTIISLQYNPGGDVRNNHDLNNRWIHLAVVWNINGIGNSNNTMQIYLDGNVVASGQEGDWGDLNSEVIDICGGNDEGIADKFSMDNLKVWNYAKTDFSDRFSE
jgi:hypothetical protein